MATKPKKITQNTSPSLGWAMSEDHRTQSDEVMSQIPHQTYDASAIDSTESVQGELPSPSNSWVSGIHRIQFGQFSEVQLTSDDSPTPRETFSDWASLKASPLVLEALDSDLEVELLHNYVSECARWFDAHNGLNHYSRLETHRMMACPPWRAAALALSAKNIELRDKRELTPGSSKLSIHLYDLAVELAIDSISGRFDVVGTLAGCVLLSVYEMMTVTYTNWRRHLQGCASIYSHRCWNGSTGGLISASFWDYARVGMFLPLCLLCNRAEYY